VFVQGRKWQVRGGAPGGRLGAASAVRRRPPLLREPGWPQPPRLISARPYRVRPAGRLDRPCAVPPLDRPAPGPACRCIH